jgi:hypothetical protein
MANPLARVVMDNIAKKSKVGTLSKSSYTLDRESKNKSRNITLKRLDRLADEIRGNTKEKPSNKNNIKSTQVTKNKNNLSLKELELLSSAIKGDLKIKPNKEVPTKHRNRLSLDGLAKNIKKGS